MLTYLDQCNDFITELGINGGQKINSVSATTNSQEARRITQFIAEADFQIQNLHQNWKFLWRQFRGTIAAGADTLGTPSNAGVKVGSTVTNLAGYQLARIDRKSLVMNYTSQTNAVRPVYQTWREFEFLWQSRGAKQPSNSPPFWSIDPAGNPIVSTTMVADQQFQYECWARPKRLISDGDVSQLVLIATNSGTTSNIVSPLVLNQPSISQSLTPIGTTIIANGAPTGEPVRESCRIVTVRAKIIYAEIEGSVDIMQAALAEYQDLLEELRANWLPSMESDRASESDIHMEVVSI